MSMIAVILAVPATSSIAEQSLRAKEIDPIVVTTVQRYEVRGLTLDDVRRELTAKGIHGDGSTTAEVTYRFTSKMQAGECVVVDVRASCLTTVILPRWYNLPTASPEAQKAWNRAYDLLKHHEMGHVRICVDVARDVERALWATPPRPQCVLTDREARLRADAIVASMAERQTAYDVKTNHH